MQQVIQEEKISRLQVPAYEAGSGAQATRNVFVGRQPIYDTERRIHAYELLYRRAETDVAEITDPNRATAQVVVNTFVDIGPDKLVSNELLFVNCTRDFLMQDAVIPPQRCVLEVLEDIEIDAALLKRLRELRAFGYRIALDDFVYAEKLAPAVELADYVKLDVLALTPGQLRNQVRQLRRFPSQLIAEKIDSEEQLAYCRKLGFDLFQGYYLRRPEVLNGKRISTSRLAPLQLIAECQTSGASMQKIAASISADVSMTYSLLRLANSAMYGGRCRIDKVSQAVVQLGTDCVLRWATLLALSSDSSCPSGYLECALQRGRMCELLAIEKTLQSPDTYFLVGLLSVVDSIIGAPMSDILQRLPLTAAIKDALLTQDGELGRVLASVLAYEVGDCANSETLRRAYWRSVSSASEMMSSLASLKT